MGNVRIEEDNPDIIIDVDAGDGEVDMSVSDRGFALTHDGEWFFYENTIYHNEAKMVVRFYAIYHALATEAEHKSVLKVTIQFCLPLTFYLIYAVSTAL